MASGYAVRHNASKLLGDDEDEKGDEDEDGDGEGKLESDTRPLTPHRRGWSRAPCYA